MGKDYGGRKLVTRPYLRVANVQDGYLDLDKITEVAVPAEDVDRHELRPGDVLMTEGGDYDKLGRGYVWEGQIKGCLHQNHIFAVRPRLCVLASRFLASLMTSLHGKNYFTATSQQTTNLASTNSTKLKNFPIPLPSTEEQTAILAFLDRETAKIDALIAKKEGLIELLHEKRTALISHTVTSGLDPQVPMKDSDLACLGKIPTHWQVKRLLNLTQTSRPIMYGIVLPGPNVPDGVPIVKGGDVAPGRLRLNRLNRTTREIESGYARSRLKEGDIVYAIRGSIGMAELVPAEIEGANLTQDAARISPQPHLDRKWLLYALKSWPVFAQLDAKATGATIRGINIRDLKRVYVAVPRAEEQAQIARFVESAASQIEGLIARVQQGIDNLREYRSALISAAVTGKIDVREEVASDGHL